MIFESAKKLINKEDNTISDELIYHWCATIESRLNLRLGTSGLPLEFEHIAVEACIELFRRYSYEGISSENDGGLSVSFVEDILNKYSKEISAYKTKNGTGGGMVKFL